MHWLVRWKRKAFGIEFSLLEAVGLQLSPDTLLYFGAYPDVLLLDCTYKSKKYKMPVLDIIGVDGG